MAVAPQSSRTGLITALVIFVVLFFVAGIFAVVKFADARRLEAELAQANTQRDRLIKKAEMTSGDFTTITELQKTERGRSAWDLLLSQRNELATRLVGTPIPGREAVDAANQANAAINKKLAGAQVSLSGSAAVADLNLLADAVAQKQEQINTLTAQLADANKKVAELANTYKGARDEHQKALDAANANAEKAMGELAAYRQSKDADVGRIEKDLAAEIERGRKTAEELSSKLAANNQQLAELQKKHQAAIQQLDRVRPKNIADSIIRKPDGRIIQVSRNNTVYINLGSGQQLTPGMTFQIYDRFEGIPPTVDAATPIDELPPGKGSLEVVRVGADSSECRIIRMAAGAIPQEGDLIANLVYEPGVKFQFKVYGDFDLDRNGVATPQEGEVLRRLIVQWGGVLTENVNIDTDFVVLGKEPVVPEKPAEDDPNEIFNYERAQKALAAYEAVREQALGLHIPVLNQNRFLYLIGYYDQARR